MDSIIHIENEKFVGRTNFRSGLLNSLVVLSVQDVPGVAHLCNKSYMFRRIFNKTLRHGVDVKFGFDGVTIDVSLWIEYGYSAAEVCYHVQENIINVVSGLIEDKVKNVNVRINGVCKKDEPKTVA